MSAMLLGCLRRYNIRLRVLLRCTPYYDTLYYYVPILCVHLHNNNNINIIDNLYYYINKSSAIIAVDKLIYYNNFCFVTIVWTN